MTRFRYDVVLHVGGQPSAPVDVAWRDWTQEQMSLASLTSCLKRSGCRCHHGRAECTARGGDPGTGVDRRSNGPATAGEIRADVAARLKRGIDPEQLWELVEGFPTPPGIAVEGCRVAAVLTSSYKSAPPDADANVGVSPPSFLPLSRYANDPFVESSWRRSRRNCAVL